MSLRTLTLAGSALAALTLSGSASGQAPNTLPVSPDRPSTYPGQRPRPFPRLVGPETLNPGAYPKAWPYPDQYNSVSAAPEVHNLRYTDAHVNFVEVAYFAGVHGQMHGHPWPSVFAIDAPSPKSVNERLDPDRQPKVSLAKAPGGAAWPTCMTMTPETPHAETNLDSWPHHFYRVEFKRLDGAAIQQNWRQWYPRMLDAQPTPKPVKPAAGAAKLSEAWPYPIDYDGLLAAPNNYRLLFEDDHVRFVEVTLRPGETEPVHGDPYPSVLAMDAISDTTAVDRFVDPKSPLNGQGSQTAGPPPEFTSPSCTTTPPRAPHALTNRGKTPIHYYRIEFKRIDGPELKDKWRAWYPWMSRLADETAKNPTRPNY